MNLIHVSVRRDFCLSLVFTKLLLGKRSTRLTCGIPRHWRNRQFSFRIMSCSQFRTAFLNKNFAKVLSRREVLEKHVFLLRISLLRLYNNCYITDENTCKIHMYRDLPTQRRTEMMSPEKGLPLPFKSK